MTNPMRNIKLTLEYDGKYFYGFQAQPKKRTVQSELEKAFQRLFRQKIKISSAAGRTDAGVHAVGQIVNFKINSEIPIRNIERALNTYLPEDLAIRKAEEVSPEFHARFQAKSKTYAYLVWNSKTRSPLLAHRAYYFPYVLNVTLMKKVAKLLIGKHDFKSFQTSCHPEAKKLLSFPNVLVGNLGPRLKISGTTKIVQNDRQKSSVRTLYALSIQKKGSEIRFLVKGNGFLYNMVRSMVGTLLFVGAGKISLQEFKKILKTKDRRHLGPTVPAHGLTLLNLQYSS